MPVKDKGIKDNKTNGISRNIMKFLVGIDDLTSYRVWGSL